MAKSTWPAWYSSPDGETKIFQSADEVPKGWTTGAEKQPVAATEPEPEADEKPKRGRPAKPLDL